MFKVVWDAYSMLVILISQLTVKIAMSTRMSYFGALTSVLRAILEKYRTT